MALYELARTAITKPDETMFGSQAITEGAELRWQLGRLVRPIGLRRSRRQLRFRLDSDIPRTGRQTACNLVSCDNDSAGMPRHGCVFTPYGPPNDIFVFPVTI